MTTVTSEAGGSVVATVPAFAVDRRCCSSASTGDPQARRAIVAPAGYGKSVLLAQWHRAHPERRRPGGGAPHRRRRPFRSPAGGPWTIAPGGRRALATSAATASPWARTSRPWCSPSWRMRRRSRSWSRTSRTLSNPVLLDELGLLAERAADGVGFVFVSRDDRLPRTLRLRLRDEVAEIRQDTLALSCGRDG